ncbi:uncharacterized protein FOMMEDRAFT_123078 [Fomitiporia mediterranea MF3/22]|uniref:uncharacterized protein n=1 Tax=Fomitiporia mediterranea (strain MF3/22) TaxID=694068 RepID=UPI0004409BE8|nr:uncharacterized protein FOMMEDRAFT_123078 [Fomitiporia mediterranea MF3/22]EJD02964.1 hypothetical protein FOMMEDRAFT_123078 [Fomitiporia mediterranea MF3/22]
MYEYEFAFFPGVPFILCFLEKLLGLAKIPMAYRLGGALLGGALVSTGTAVFAVHTLYDLTMHHFQSPHIALLVSLLSLLSSSPATLRYASYAEPFFTFLSYKGMYYCSKGQFSLASLSFMLAGFFRSNGTILVGYIVWGVLIEPILHSSTLRRDTFSGTTGYRILRCLVLSIPPLVPFLWHQYNGYTLFCNVPSGERRPWCTKKLPLIYSFVQSEYWNVGFLRYWSLQQAPNILLAMPVLALLFYGSVSYIRAALLPRICNFVECFRRSPTSLRSGPIHDKASEQIACQRERDPFLGLSLAPHAIHALFLSIVLLTAAHTQIALRLASALPFTYWTAARLFLCKTSVGSSSQQGIDDHVASWKPYRVARWWVCWSMVMGAVSLVTWGVFLPPA